MFVSVLFYYYLNIVVVVFNKCAFSVPALTSGVFVHYSHINKFL